MKRYWVKLTLEVKEYDEQKHTVKDFPGFKWEPATGLTPEPSEFIRDTLVKRCEDISKVLTAEPVEEPHDK